MPAGVYERTPEHRAKIGAALRGRPKSEAHKAALSEVAKRRARNFAQAPEAASPFWMGEQAGYMAKHNWVRKRLGKANRHMCARCGWHAQEWANISGKYHRDLSDYMPLCIRCHRTMDGHRTRTRRAA